MNAALVPDMQAGRTMLSAFTRHAGTFHKGLSSARGWGLFAKFCRSEVTMSNIVASPAARVAFALLKRL